VTARFWVFARKIEAVTMNVTETKFVGEFSPFFLR
jgi:hypothetical protein